MTKIELMDTGRDVLVKMAGGNPGALNALMEILKHGGTIDPQGALGGMGVILSLDTLGIYGSEIYILWSDQCHKDTRELLMLLRANQLGFVGGSEIKAAAKDQRGRAGFSPEKMDEFNEKVCTRLLEFQPRKEPASEGC